MCTLIWSYQVKETIYIQLKALQQNTNNYRLDLRGRGNSWLTRSAQRSIWPMQSHTSGGTQWADSLRKWGNTRSSDLQ